MGPHSFECGNMIGIFEGRDVGDMLQWGRTRSSAEIDCRARRRDDHRPRFNGAALVRVRKCGPSRSWAGSSWTLQWGRTRSSAEIRPPGGARSPGQDASMGPHSFECGNDSSGFFGLAAADRLQWGRTRSSAEISRGVVREFSADVLQWGRTRSSAEMRPANRRRAGRAASFNGAALVRVRKCIRSRRAAAGEFALQWGRTRSSAEISSSWLMASIKSSLQWGRTRSSAEIVQVRCSVGWRPCSFNGAALVRVRKSSRGWLG